MGDYKKKSEIEIKKLEGLFDDAKDNTYAVEISQIVSMLINVYYDLKDDKLDVSLLKLSDLTKDMITLMNFINIEMRERKWKDILKSLDKDINL